MSVYDLVVLGGGPAGLEAAETAARLGRRVALVERSELGGNSLNAGSVPSKAIIRSARACETMRDGDEFGVPAATVAPLDLGTVLARMRRIRTRIAEYHSAERLRAMGIEVFFSEARFTAANAVVAGGAQLLFKKALIATGARPAASNIPGLDGIGFLTSTTIFEIKRLPDRLAIIGGGPLGCELAQALCRLGSHVTILQNEPKFLPCDDKEAAELLSMSLSRDGVTTRLNTTVVGARMGNGDKLIDTVNNGVKATIAADEVMLSIGRVPNVEDLGLQAAGVAFNSSEGIKVDDFLRTTNADIYSAGDVCMSRKFTNVAQASARMAVSNACNGERKQQSHMMIPWCTHCDPEIAHIGLHTWDARQRSIPIKTFTVMMQDVDRAITDGQDEGFVKIHVREGSDEILGATIVAARAGEMINEMSVIMGAGIGMRKLAGILHAYPSQSDAIRLAAVEYMRSEPQ